MPTDSFSYALERLDPASRALLDLSLRRGMRTEEIAEVLGAEPESVEASRDEALQRIASDVGMDELDEVRARLAELPAAEWLGGGGNGSAPVAEPVDAQTETETEAETPVAADKPKRRLWPLLLGLLVTAGVIVAIALATSSSSDKKASTSNSTPPAASNPQPKPKPKPAKPGAAKLTAIAGGASGTATVSSGKLHLQASGLGRGHYQVWLYNSIIDARPIGQANGGRFTVNASLPGNWKRWRYVDVSREPRDGNLSHSGESVLRVPTAQLVP